MTFINMSNISYFTIEKLQQLRNELHDLKTKGRADIARQIAEARDKGDLSENAEYDAAKDAQGLLEMKIAKLEELIANARIIDESKIDTSKVSILSKVKIKNIKNNAEMTYVIVSEEEANLKENKISVKSPIGSAILGKAVGDVVEVVTPSGKMQFKIIHIGR
ncbi:MAG: transcription elongation factor GreA [Flammeovirgaceae bacterium]